MSSVADAGVPHLALRIFYVRAKTQLPCRRLNQASEDVVVADWLAIPYRLKYQVLAYGPARS